MVLLVFVCIVLSIIYFLKVVGGGRRILPTIKTFDPATFIDKGWKVLEAETDRRASALEQVDFTKANLETCFKQGETHITGEEKLKRLKEGGNIRLGSETFLALWTEEGQKTLEWLHGEKGVACFDFFGTILEGPYNDRFVLRLYRYGYSYDEGRVFGGWKWDWTYYWLGNDWDDGDYTLCLPAG